MGCLGAPRHEPGVPPVCCSPHLMALVSSAATGRPSQPLVPRSDVPHCVPGRRARHLERVAVVARAIPQRGPHRPQVRDIWGHTWNVVEGGDTHGMDTTAFTPSLPGPRPARFDPTAFVRARQRRQKETELKK